MLVLARKTHEVIYIGNEIVIKVINLRNGVVRIGIDAPESIRVLRGELKQDSAEPQGDRPPLANMVAARRMSAADPQPTTLRRIGTVRN